VNLIDDEETARPDTPGSTLRMNRSLPRRSGEINRMSHESAASAASAASHSAAVRAADGECANADARSGFDLIAHQRKERAYKDRRPCTLIAQKLCRKEVDEALAPASALDYEDPAAACDDGVDGLPLTLAKPSLEPKHPPK